MTFQDLQIGDYFKIPSLSVELVYRKSNNSQCSALMLLQPSCNFLNLLQPIRPGLTIIPLTHAEIKHHFAAKQADLQHLKQ